MTPQQEFYAKLTALAALCPGFVLSPEIIAIYDQALAALGYPQASRALEHVILTRNSRDPFPSVKEIRAVVIPEEDPEDGAAVIASQIYGCIGSIGPYAASSARRVLGDVAWRVVQMEGGWETLCEAVNYDNATTHKAQWRKLAAALLRREEGARVMEAIESGNPHPLKLPSLNMLRRLGSGIGGESEN